MATDEDSPLRAVECQVCVFLWALPRSLSTTTAKCMSFVEGVQVWHEPYLYSYHNEKFRDPLLLEQLEKRPHMDFMKGLKQLEPILEKTPRGKRIDNDFFQYAWVKSQLESQDPDKKLIFIKDMAHVMNGKYEHLPTSRKFRHTFLIRDPRRMYLSFLKLVGSHRPVGSSGDNKSDADILYDTDQIYKYTYNLWRHTKEHLDPDAIIIDATELAAQPEKLLPEYFHAIGVPYKEDYLKWDPGHDVITDWKASFVALVGAQYWGVFKRAFESSCFIPEGPPPSRDSLPPDVIRCVDVAQPYYDLMYEQRIKP